MREWVDCFVQIGLKKKTAAGAAAAAKEAEEHAKEAEKKSSNHVQRKLKARTQNHKIEEVRDKKFCGQSGQLSTVHIAMLPS